jgi:hypothetical protein
VRAKVLVVFRRRNTPESYLNPNILSLIGNLEMLLIGKHTLSISRVSTTLVQSISAILNADQGMCLTSRLLCRKVVIGPYISSAEAKNKAIGWKTHLNETKKEKEELGGPDEVCPPGLTFYKRSPIECCCVKGSSRLREVRSGAACSESTRYVDQMLVSTE